MLSLNPIVVAGLCLRFLSAISFIAPASSLFKNLFIALRLPISEGSVCTAISLLMSIGAKSGVKKDLGQVLKQLPHYQTNNLQK